jgi:hypothetical protein
VNPADIIRCVNDSGIPASAAEKLYSLNARKLFRI